MRNCFQKIARRFRGLRELDNFGDAVLFLRLFLFAMAVPLLMRLRLPTLKSLLDPAFPPPVPDQARAQKIISYADHVITMGKPLVRSSCLTRGITLYYFLRRAGLEVNLCFGTGELEGEFVAHCWLVREERPFLEAKDPGTFLTEVYRFSSNTASSKAGPE